MTDEIEIPADAISDAPDDGAEPPSDGEPIVDDEDEAPELDPSFEPPHGLEPEDPEAEVNL